MPLPSAHPARRLHHRRRLDVQVYARDDGLWDVDARLTDVRAGPLALARGPLPAGEPLHEMLLRLVVDERFEIVDAGSQTLAMPYPGECDHLDDAYRRLIGLNLMRGFRQAVKERLGGVRGCTHLSELTQVVPTAVVQAFAGTVIDVRGDADDSARPFQIDRCHALRADGPAVAAYYPKWYRAPEPGAPSSDSRIQPETSRP